MTDCLVVQPIAEAGLRVLDAAGLSTYLAPLPDLALMRPHLATARAVITRNHGFSAAEIAAAPRLQVIVSHGTGTDSIDKAAAARRGIVVASTPGTNARSVAEHCLGLMLACARALPAADRATRAGDFDFRLRQETVELAGKTLGLVGYGRIARLVGTLARALGMRVCVFSKHAGAEDIAADGFEPVARLDALCRSADVLSLHGVPADECLIDARRIALMKPEAILVNTARGALLDEAALVEALETGRLRAAALDVFRSEPPTDRRLLRSPNLILTPHMGGSAKEALARTAVEAARKVVEILKAGHAS
jgi:D-3-phosphoglycerate dehydrogenase / 2-oxoglutarate reductase